KRCVAVPLRLSSSSEVRRGHPCGRDRDNACRATKSRERRTSFPHGRRTSSRSANLARGRCAEPAAGISRPARFAPLLFSGTPASRGQQRKRLAEMSLRAGFLWISSLLLVLLAGSPLVLLPDFSRLSLPARAALAAACGAVTLSFLMTLWALAGWSWSIPVLVAAAFGVSLLLRSLFPSSIISPPIRDRRTAMERVAVGLLVLSVGVAFVATATGSASSVDLILFWGPKAQAFAASRTIDSGFLSDPSLKYLHTSYPPLETNLTAFASIAAGCFAWGAATLVFPILLALLAAALPSLLRLATPPAIAMSAAALAVAGCGFLGDAFDIAGNGDMPLLFFETLAGALLIGTWALEKGGQLLAGLMLAGAASTKVEGLPFALGIGLLFLLVRRKEIRNIVAASL